MSGKTSKKFGYPIFEKKNKSKYLFLILSSVTAGLFVAVGVMAWTSPSGNPPSGEGILYSSNGKIGINTSSPSYPLTVSSSTDSLFGLIRFGATYPSIFKLGTDSTLVINAGNSDVLTLKSGNVGVGNTNPSYALDVAGTIRSSSGGFRFPDGTTQASASSLINGGSQTVSEGSTASRSCAGGTTIIMYTTRYYCASNFMENCGTCSYGSASCSITFNNTNCGGDPCPGEGKSGTLSIVCVP